MRSLFDITSTRATGVFREMTECHFGPTKGSKFPLATEGAAVQN